MKRLAALALFLLAGFAFGQGSPLMQPTSIWGNSTAGQAAGTSLTALPSGVSVAFANLPSGTTGHFPCWASSVLGECAQFGSLSVLPAGTLPSNVLVPVASIQSGGLPAGVSVALGNLTQITGPNLLGYTGAGAANVGLVTPASLQTTIAGRTVTTNTITAASTDVVICANPSSNSPTTVQLESSPATNRTLTVKDCAGTAATYPITINPAGSTTIDGNSSYTITIGSGAWTGYFNGTNWFTIWNFAPGYSVPAEAAAVGYNQNTLLLTNFTSSNVDTTYSLPSAKTTATRIYPYNFGFYHPPGTNGTTGVPPTDISLPGDGTILLAGAANAEISTVGAVGASDFVGTAFGNGGYFEWTVSFPNGNYGSGNAWTGTASQSGSVVTITATASGQLTVGSLFCGNVTCTNGVAAFSYITSFGTYTTGAGTGTVNVSTSATVASGSAVVGGGWPAMWYQTLEGSVIYAASTCSLSPASPHSTAWSAQPCPHWPLQATGYRHQNEDDAAEYIAQQVGAAFHESFGIFGTTCTSFCQYSTSTGQMPKYPSVVIGTTNMAIPHKYGRLWVMATATTSGYTAYYFDDVLQNKSPLWTQWQDTGNAPYDTSTYTKASNTLGATTPSYLYGVMDLYHSSPIAGAGNGGSAGGGGMIIYKFAVYQKDNSQNVTK